MDSSIARITSSCSGAESAETIFMVLPHFSQRSGSSSQTLRMRWAQPRLRARMNSGSASSRTVVVCGCDSPATVGVGARPIQPKLAESGGERSVGSDLALVAMLDVRDEQGEELDACEELMVASEAGMVAALVVNHAGIAQGQALERDGCALHVLEDRLELAPVARRDDPFSVNAETRMGPGSHECRSLFIDRSTLLEGVEERVTERKLQLGEVDVDADAIAAKSIDGVERSLSIEDAARDQRVSMGMEIQ